MKKAFSFALILVVTIVLCFTGCGKAPDEIGSAAQSESGTNQGQETSASDFKYSVNEEAAAITEYIGTDKTVVIPEKIEGKNVTTIFSCAFQNKSIKKVIIPSTVTQIWDHAFAYCDSLKVVIFGDNVTEIMEQAFYKCTLLAEIVLPQKLEKLGHQAFSSCSSLKKVLIPKNMNQMGMEAFLSCPIEELILEDGIKKFGAYASFWGATLKELTIPASVEEISEYTFHDHLEKVTFLGDAPKELGKQPFGTNATIYYKKGTNGWEDTALKKEYQLIAQK